MMLLATICDHSKVSYDHLQKVEPDSVEKLADGGSVVELTIDKSVKKCTTVAFCTPHQYVDVYVDGRDVYSLKETAGRWGHTTGHVWNFVLLPVNATQSYSETFALLSRDRKCVIDILCWKRT